MTAWRSPGSSIAVLTFYSPQENVVDLLPDEGTQTQELSIDAMQNGLQEVPLPRVLAVKQLQELKAQTQSPFFLFFVVN